MVVSANHPAAAARDRPGRRRRVYLWPRILRARDLRHNILGASSRSAGRVGLRQLVVLAALVSAALAPTLSGSPPHRTWCWGRCSWSGSAQGTLASSSAALISLFAPASRQGTAFGILTSAQSLAMGIGPLSGGLIASATTLRTPFASSGVLLLAGALLVLTVPAPPTTSRRRGGGLMSVDATVPAW